jgi:hypothetical protein
MQPPASKCAAIIGDVIASRGYGDQTRLLEGVADVLAAVNAVTTSRQPLQITIGDEFQGAFLDLGTALDACLQTRLRLVGLCDVRFGIGWGEIVASDPQRAPMAQSGSAWWAARAALEHASDATSRQEWPRGTRTWFQGSGHDTDRIVNAFLLCRDELVTKMDDRAARAALGLLLGKRQSDLARELGITQPSVSSRQHGSGAVAVVRAHEILKGLVP